MPQRVVVNVSTGQSAVQELTAEEAAQRDAEQQAASHAAAQQQMTETARAGRRNRIRAEAKRQIPNIGGKHISQLTTDEKVNVVLYFLALQPNAQFPIFNDDDTVKSIDQWPG